MNNRSNSYCIIHHKIKKSKQNFFFVGRTPRKIICGQECQKPARFKSINKNCQKIFFLLDRIDKLSFSLQNFDLLSKKSAFKNLLCQYFLFSDLKWPFDFFAWPFLGQNLFIDQLFTQLHLLH